MDAIRSGAVLMAFDVHAHLTVDVPAQLARARLAGVECSVLLATRTHPEGPTTLDGLRAELGRLEAVVGGSQSPRDDYRNAMTELRGALDAHPDELTGFATVPLGLDYSDTGAWLDDYLGQPGIVGIGELTPAPGSAQVVEPALAVSADHGGLPVLVHGFAPTTVGDLRSYADLAGRFPQVPVVVGAFGGLNWLTLIDLALERPNLYIDLSSALQVFAIRAAVQVLPERCLFGSNTPYGDVLAARCTAEAAIIDKGALGRILEGNLAELIGR